MVWLPSQDGEEEGNLPLRGLKHEPEPWERVARARPLQWPLPVTGRRKGPPGECVGAGAPGGAFLPCSHADRAGEGPLGRGLGGAPLLSPPPPQLTATLLPQGICSQEREKWFPKVLFFLKVMGPVSPTHPQAEGQDPARQVGW